MQFRAKVTDPDFENLKNAGSTAVRCHLLYYGIVLGACRCQNLHFLKVFWRLWPWTNGPCPRLPLDLEVHFPWSDAFLGSYLLSRCTVRRFCRDPEAVIKSTPSAASRKSKTQENREASRRWLGMRTQETARLPWFPGFWSCSCRLR